MIQRMRDCRKLIPKWGHKAHCLLLNLGFIVEEYESQRCSTTTRNIVSSGHRRTTAHVNSQRQWENAQTCVRPRQTKPQHKEEIWAWSSIASQEVIGNCWQLGGDSVFSKSTAPVSQPHSNGRPHSQNDWAAHIDLNACLFVSLF